MSLRLAVGGALLWGRSLLRGGPRSWGPRLVGRLRAGPPPAGPPWARYYRSSLRGLAARLQAAALRRSWGGGAARNRSVFLAFGLGLGLLEQLEDDRRSEAACSETQVVTGVTSNELLHYWDISCDKCHVKMSIR